MHKQTSAELNFLIEYSYKISLSFFKSRFTSIEILLHSDGLTVEDIAMDAIIPLFINNSESNLRIVKSLELWKNEITNEAEAEYFLMQIIWKRAQQTITALLKQRDPIFEKIHKTLSTCIAKYELKKTYHFGTIYISKKNTEILTGNLINDDFFNSIPISLFRFKQITLFNKLFEYIKTESDFTPAIPLNKLVKQIKQYYFNSYNIYFSKQNNFDDSFVYHDIVDESLKIIDEKLVSFYINKNKLSELEAKSIMNSFKDISIDIKNGGLYRSLYSYLKKNKPSLTKENFYAEYFGVMNYLFNQFKTEIVKNFE